MSQKNQKQTVTYVTSNNDGRKVVKKKKLTMFNTFLLVAMIPIVLLVVGVISGVIIEFNAGLSKVVFEKLQVASEALAVSYEYDIKDEASAQKIFEDEDYESIDSMKDKNIEQTIFIGDVRAQTSLIGEDGKRMVGTSATAGIWETVSQGNTYQAQGVPIGGAKYYVFYSPLHAEDGTIVGMAFAGESDNHVRAEIWSTTRTIVIVIFVVTVILLAVVVLVAKKVTNVLSQVVKAANRLASGDLTGENIKDSSIQDIYEIMLAIRNIRNNIKGVVTDTSHQLFDVNTDMNGMGESVTNGIAVSNAVTGAVNDITSGASETADSIQNVTASMQEIGTKIESISSIADNTTAKTTEIKAVSSQAQGSLGELIKANRATIDASGNVVEGIMNASEASQKISEVVQTVEEIAEETKLLSLNASIEAARAGEAGRGFAVVADSIQGLAQQSTDSVNQIRQIIEEITAASDNNVRLANEIKEAINNEGAILKSVSEGVDTVTDRVNGMVEDILNIKDETAELNESKNSVLDEISSLSALSEQTAASCQETSTSMEELNNMMAGINQSTSKTKDVCDKVITTMEYFKI